MDLQPQYMRDDEIDLREVFLVLWKGKWVIIALVIAAALAAGVGGRMLLTPTYDAVATLLIMPPTYQSVIEPEPLPLQTYQALALTPAIASQVVERLQLMGAKDELLKAGDVLQAVGVEVSVPQGTRSDNRQIAGILNIKVAWSDPIVARDIANTWADVFMENTSHIRKSESDEIARVILNQYDSTEDVLKDSERRLLEFKASGSLPLASQQVELLTSQLGERREYALRIQTDLDTKRNQLEALTSQLVALEQDGEWLGLLTRDISKLNDDGNPARKRIIEAMRQVVQARTTLTSFENQAKVSLAEEELKLEQAQLPIYRKSLADLKARLPQQEARLSALTSALQGQDEKLVMSRSLTTDAMWMAVAGNQQSLDELVKLRLIDESANPTYQHIARTLADTQVELATIPEQMTTHEKLIKASVDRIVDLESGLRELHQKRQALEDQLILSTQLYDSLREHYASMKQQGAQLAGEVAMLEAEVQLASGELEKQETAVLIAERELLELQLEEDGFMRNIESLERTHRALSEQAESARLVELQATGDVRFVSPAVAPRSPSGPNHKLNVAIAVVLAGMVGVGVVFISNMFSNPIA